MISLKNYKEKFLNYPFVQFLTPLYASYKHISRFLGVVSALLGFLGDFLKPSINISPYLIILALVGFFISLYLFRKKMKIESLALVFKSKTSSFLVFSGLSVLVWIVISIIYFVTPPKGITATLIPEVAELQEKILSLEQEVSELKTKVLKIKRKIEALSQNSLVIEKPKEAAEFYHNARIYELKGNAPQAIEAYEKFLELEPDFSDPHQDYQSLALKTGGENRVQKFYAALQKHYPNHPIIELMANRLTKNREKRLNRLIELAEQYPKVGPIFYKLALEYLRPGYENLSIEEIQGAKLAFDQFKALDEKGFVTPYFIDKTVMSELRRKVNGFERRYSTYYKAILEEPFTVRFRYQPNGVKISIDPYDQTIQKTFYSIDDPNFFKGAETSTITNRVTNKPEKTFSVSGKLSSGKHTLYLKYLDPHEKESKVFSKEFEVPPIEAEYEISSDYDLTEENIKYQISFFSLDGKKYRYFYQSNQKSTPQEVLGNDKTEISFPTGSHEIFYYGVSDGEKTPVYSLKVSP